MAQRTEAIYQGRTIGIESIYTVIDGKQINIPEKAAGLSSNMDDYFDRKDAVLVAMK